MDNVFKKLNLGSCGEILVFNSPDSFESALATLRDVKVLRRIGPTKHVPFGIAFAMTLTELCKVSRKLASCTEGDAIVWIAYPKKSSKRYQGELGRDSDWSDLGNAGFEPVRQIAIDEDWSALRFRRTEYIKKLTRSGERAISELGKQRLAKKQ